MWAAWLSINVSKNVITAHKVLNTSPWIDSQESCVIDRCELSLCAGIVGYMCGFCLTSSLNPVYLSYSRGWCLIGLPISIVWSELRINCWVLSHYPVTVLRFYILPFVDKGMWSQSHCNSRLPGKDNDVTNACDWWIPAWTQTTWNTDEEGQIAWVKGNTALNDLLYILSISVIFNFEW